MGMCGIINDVMWKVDGVDGVRVFLGFLGILEVVLINCLFRDLMVCVCF